MAALFAFVVIAAPLLGLWLHAREKRREREGVPRGTGGTLVRAGLLEMQYLLEPERKVEVLREAETKEDLLVRVDAAGDPNDTGGAPGATTR